MDVCIIMTTFNGERFLRDQIDSILSQLNVKVTLVVRDDGSTDHTREILKEYESKGSLTFIDDNIHRGAANGFMELLYTSPNAEYYAFADQDDIWLPNKIEKAIELIGDNDKPTLYCSNQIIYKENKEVGLRFTEEPNYTLTNCICGNSIAGCTMVFNKALRNIIINPSHRPTEEILRIRMHDVWVLLCAHAAGNVIYDQNAYIKYRLHENNTVGIRHANIAHKIKKLLQIIIQKDKRNGRSKIARELLKVEFVREADESIAREFATYDCSLKNKVNLLTNPIIKKDCSERRGIFILKTFFNIL